MLSQHQPIREAAPQAIAGEKNTIAFSSNRGEPTTVSGNFGGTDFSNEHAFSVD